MSARADDFERLAVRWAQTPYASLGYPSAIAAITAFPEVYATSRDSLPQTDADRAFALMGKAADILDGTLLFASDDDQANALTAEAIGYLDEALKLDPTCYDAMRMRYMLEHGTRDVMVSFLTEREGQVRARCVEVARAANMLAPEGHWSVSVFQRPYLRWLFNLANEQLNCGRYMRSLEVCDRLMALDEQDAAGARMIAALDYVKLEDADGLAALEARFATDRNAWFDLCDVFMAYKRQDLATAATRLHAIVRDYPGAGNTLTAQDEVSAGAFARLSYQPRSADELYIAVSESAVILDENCGDAASALSDWIADDPIVRHAFDAESAKRREGSDEAGDASDAGGSRGAAASDAGVPGVSGAPHAPEGRG